MIRPAGSAHDAAALESITVRLRATGDGRKRTEEVVADAISRIATDPALRAAWAKHPNLRTVSPESLLGKVSRKRASRVLESGLLLGSFDEDTSLVPDVIFGRGKEIDANVPLSMLLSEMDFLPPRAAVGVPPLTVLYENSEWVAFDKPSGLPTAPLRSDEEDSVVQRALALYPDLPVLRGNPLEPGLVHRLDTGTSGVLLFAKTIEAFIRIDRIWNTGQVRKIYRAWTAARPSREGRIELKLGHDEKSKRRMRVVENSVDLKRIRGEPTRSLTEVMSIDESDGACDVTVRIETGVHHQIRATLAHLGAPILGDSIYAGAPDSRLWLHAWKLELPGENGQSFEIVAPVPLRGPELPMTTG